VYGAGALVRSEEEALAATTGPPLALIEAVEVARQYPQRAKAANTTRAYASD